MYDGVAHLNKTLLVFSLRNPGAYDERDAEFTFQTREILDIVLKDWIEKLIADNGRYSFVIKSDPLIVGFWKAFTDFTGGVDQAIDYIFNKFRVPINTSAGFQVYQRPFGADHLLIELGDGKYIFAQVI